MQGARANPVLGAGAERWTPPHLPERLRRRPVGELRVFVVVVVVVVVVVILVIVISTGVAVAAVLRVFPAACVRACGGDK